jgi:hypothetical protein
MTIIACSNSHMLEEKKKNKKEKKELGSMQYIYYIVIQQVSSVTRASSPQSFDQCQSVSLVDRTCKFLVPKLDVNYIYSSSMMISPTWEKKTHTHKKLSS